MSEQLIEDIYECIHKKIDEVYNISNKEMSLMIDEIVRMKGQNSGLSINEMVDISKQIYADIRGYSVLQELLEDDSITEIMVNGYDQIYVEQAGKLFKSNVTFESSSKLESLIQKIVSQVNRSVNEASPICDARLVDGSRINVVLPPVALNGPILTIRKFSGEMMGMDDLLKNGSLSKDMATFLNEMVQKKQNIFISGGTGSGKTTLLNILSNYISENERVITIEDSAELSLKAVNHIVRLEARKANSEGCVAIGIRDLIKSALRMRPDRLIVGEVRGEEAIDMLQAMNTGHDGSLSTGHANSPKDMISRLETMILLKEDIPMKAIRAQMASAIDMMIHLGRTENYERKILSISQVMGISEGEIILKSLYVYDAKEDSFNRTGDYEMRH